MMKIPLRGRKEEQYSLRIMWIGLVHVLRLTWLYGLKQVSPIARRLCYKEIPVFACRLDPILEISRECWEIPLSTMAVLGLLLPLGCLHRWGNASQMACLGAVDGYSIPSG